MTERLFPSDNRESRELDPPAAPRAPRRRIVSHLDRGQLFAGVTERGELVREVPLELEAPEPATELLEEPSSECDTGTPVPWARGIRIGTVQQFETPAGVVVLVGRCAKCGATVVTAGELAGDVDGWAVHARRPVPVDVRPREIRGQLTMGGTDD